MRFRRDITAIVVLLLIFLGGGLLLGGQDATKSRQVGRELVPDPSIYNDRASGSRAAFDWVAKLGYKPAPWRRDWAALDQSGAPVLLVIDPRASAPLSSLTGAVRSRRGSDTDRGDDPTILAPADAAALRSWLGAGHTAVLMSSRLPSGRVVGGDPDDQQDTFADALNLVVETAAEGSNTTEFGPLQPTADTQNVLSLHSESAARVRRTLPDGVALFGDASGPVVLSLPVGPGRLVVIADSRFASNTNLPRSENAVFLANLLARYAHPGDAVLFDEYHHGDADLLAGETVWSVLGRPLQLALIQLLLATVVLVGVLAVRFGTPVPLLRGLSRGSSEYVTSLAGLYRQAQASATALEILYRQFLRDLTARFALPPDVSLEHLADVVARRGQVDKNALRRLLATCEQRLDEGKTTDIELLTIVREMERIRKDAGIA